MEGFAEEGDVAAGGGLLMVGRVSSTADLWRLSSSRSGSARVPLQPRGAVTRGCWPSQSGDARGRPVAQREAACRRLGGAISVFPFIP